MDSSRRDGFWAGVNPARIQELDAIRSNPGYQAGMERMRRIIRRPQLAFAFVDEPLADDLLAVVYLSQRSTLARYAVVSRIGFDDAVYLGALGARSAYEMRHEDDTSPVTIRVYRDGRVSATSEKHGPNAFEGSQESQLIHRTRGSSKVLARMSDAQVQLIPGHGPARVVQLD